MYIIFAVVVVLIIIIVAKTTYDADDYLYGFWAAEGDKFCEDSGISSMMLFVGDGSRGFFTRNRQCYIVITDGFSNQGFSMDYRYALATPLSCKWSTTATVKFDDEQIWPETVKIEVDRHTGTLTVKDGDTVYARLHKHHDITNAAKCVDVE